MITRSQTRAKALVWMRLPAEIRLMVLEAIASQKNPGWASLASVCREWQHVLERANFHKIKLGISCLDGFERVATIQKREIIRHVCLNVTIPPTYFSKKRSQSVRIGSMVSRGIWKLFSILSTWTPTNDLALEINVHSPSDCKYWFKNIYVCSDNTEHYEDATPETWRTGPRYHDPKHGWIHGQQVRRPPRAAIQRLFRPIPLWFPMRLPQVKAVNCLIIRRQLRRSILPSGLDELVRSLDRLENISYEPWAPYDSNCRYYFGRGNLPDTVKRLTIFRDAYKFYDSFPRRPTSAAAWSGWPSWLYHCELLWVNFASQSLKLQHLAISYMVNAEDIFQRCQPTWTWSQLESLALTSELLQDNWEKRSQLEALLCRAGILAQQMPKLHRFVLWNGGKGHACAFIYCVGRDNASITWRGTWQLELRPLVVERWQLVASKLPYYKYGGLQIKQENIQGVIHSHGDAIHHLELPCQVVDPASLWQIRREGYTLTQ
ncbi:hypothetical protein F5Y14DRAFT_444123 [Nemania sp. NC0429]|nr:hypothetical protein F5Y14DRAFT_444123 [Nemania sp. NC0429]